MGFSKELSLHSKHSRQMNSTSSEKWLSTKVLHRLPEASIAVFNNVPYQCKQLQSRHEVKAEVIA
jgi:hypothetical protein